MYAGISSGQVTPDELDAFAQVIREEVIPKARELPGFQGGYWLADREGGHVIGIVLFESEEALRASHKPPASDSEESSRSAQPTPPSVVSYEVVAAVGGAAESGA
jgi:heme-degrading monooxygenase HmoA